MSPSIPPDAMTIGNATSNSQIAGLPSCAPTVRRPPSPARDSSPRLDDGSRSGIQQPRPSTDARMRSVRKRIPKRPESSSGLRPDYPSKSGLGGTPVLRGAFIAPLRRAAQVAVPSSTLRVSRRCIPAAPRPSVASGLRVCGTIAPAERGPRGGRSGCRQQSGIHHLQQVIIQTGSYRRP